MRNNLHNLDLTKKDDYEVYKSARFEFVASEENDKLKNFIEKVKKNNTNYYDTEIMSNKSNELVQIVNGNPTIGYGFDTITSGGQQEWNDAFLEYNKNNPDNRIEIPNMNDVINLKRGMTPRELEILANHSIEIREKQLANIYSNTWNKMNPRLRLVTESMYYNGGNKLVGNSTRYKQNLENYIYTGNKNYLDNVMKEILIDSNKDLNTWTGIQQRRQKEAKLLYEPDQDDTKPLNQNKTHFRWIHSKPITDKSNPLHTRLDGKIFTIDSKEWEYITFNRMKGCKCTYELLD